MKIKNIQNTPKTPKNPSSTKTYNTTKELVKTKVLGVGITNATTVDVLEYIINCIKKSSENFYIVTPNPEILVYAYHHSDFADVLNNAKIALNDGAGNGIAARILGKELPERLTGVDSMKMLCEKVANQPITVGFLGGGPKIAEMTSECLKREFPGLRVAFVGEEWEESGNGKWEMGNGQNERDKNHTPSPISHTQQVIDILFVAFGFPKQEEWMARHLNNIPVRVMMGVGGAFDYISGHVSRAPFPIRAIGLEWLYRVIRQPWRWKRQLALLEFAWLVLKEKLHPSS